MHKRQLLPVSLIPSDMPSTATSTRLLLLACLLHLFVSASTSDQTLRSNRKMEPDWAVADMSIKGTDLLTPVRNMNGRKRPNHLGDLVVDWRFPIQHGNGQFIPPTEYDCTFNCNKEQEYEWVACMLWTQEPEQKTKCPDFTDPGRDFKVPIKELDCHIPCIYDDRLSARGKRDCRIAQLNTRAFDHCDAVGNYLGNFDAERSLKARHMKKVAESMTLTHDEIAKRIEEDEKWYLAERYNNAKEWRETTCPDCEPTEEELLQGEKLTREQQAAIPQYEVMKAKNGTGYVVVRTNPPHAQTQNEGTPMWEFDHKKQFIQTKSSEFHRGSEATDVKAGFGLDTVGFGERVKREMIKEKSKVFLAYCEKWADLWNRLLIIAVFIFVMYLIYKTKVEKNKAEKKKGNEPVLIPKDVLITVD